MCAKVTRARAENEKGEQTPLLIIQVFLRRKSLMRSRVQGVEFSACYYYSQPPRSPPGSDFWCLQCLVTEWWPFESSVIFSRPRSRFKRPPHSGRLLPHLFTLQLIHQLTLRDRDIFNSTSIDFSWLMLCRDPQALEWSARSPSLVAEGAALCGT